MTNPTIIKFRKRYRVFFVQEFLSNTRKQKIATYCNTEMVDLLPN